MAPARTTGISAGWPACCGRAARHRAGDHRQPALRLEPGRGHDRLTDHRDWRCGDRYRRRRRVDDPIALGDHEAGPAIPRRRPDRVRPRSAGGWSTSACRPSGRCRSVSPTSYGRSSTSPRERQDAFAYRSHRLAAQAWEDGFYDDLVTAVPDTELARDEGVAPTPRREARQAQAVISAGRNHHRRQRLATQRRSVGAADGFGEGSRGD